MATVNCLSVLLTFLFFKMVLCAEYYVRPSEDSASSCLSQHCLTLNEYLQDPTTFSSGSTFTLLQGRHLLNQAMSFSGVTGITLRGAGTNGTLIFLDGIGSITWNNSREIKIGNLEILYASRNELSHHTALTVEKSQLQISNVQFTGSEIYSQGIRLSQSKVSFISCSFRHWHANIGGAVYADASNVSFSNYTSFIQNTAEQLGGGIYAGNNSTITFAGTNIFLENKAGLHYSYSTAGGAVMHSLSSTVQLNGNSMFRRNGLSYNEGSSSITALQSIVTILNKSIFRENLGCIYGKDSYLAIEGEHTFTHNHGHSECIGMHNGHFIGNGRITFDNNIEVNYPIVILLNSIFSFIGEVYFVNNIALPDGAQGTLNAVNSHIYCEGEAYFVNNSVSNGNGGGICIMQSILEFNGNVTFANNSATQGGGLYALGSVVNITGSALFHKNTAMEGGGMVLDRRGIIDLRSLEASFSLDTSDSNLVLQSPITLTFDHNMAVSKGGGVYYISSNTCETLYDETCFFEIQSEDFPVTNVQLNFIQNSAGQAGSEVYGSSLDYCSVEVNKQYYINESFQFLKNENGSIPQFSSDPNAVFFCDNENYLVYNDETATYDDSCSYYNDCASIYVKRGEHFNLSVTAVGQGSVTVPATIRADVENNDHLTELIPRSHLIERKCTNITLQLFATDTNKTIILYPDGPCSTSRKKVYVILTSCPPGFNLDVNRCVCEEALVKQNLIKCDADNFQFQRLGNSWAEPIWDENQSYLGFVYHPECPTGYCKSEREVQIVYFKFSPDENDPLCTQKRTGRLCGACKEGFSLTLNSFNCKNCPNSYISLLIFFGFAGVALIAMLLALHMTVAAGTINGLILYANIVNVNSIIFYPSHHSNVLTVFISWLNLDLGIETCFFDGLDFYSYAWLQYAFPFYLWFLIGMIILSNKLSSKVGKLFGSNPVAVLATVMLMSYTKLLQATILTLSNTTLNFSNHTVKRVWLYDANINYLKGNHVFLSIMALCVICLLLIPFIFLMLFGYQLQAYSEKKALQWLNKFKPLLDAYYASYRPKMRFWPGFMLLVRGCLNLVTALSSFDEVKLIVISSLFTSVLALAWRVHEKLYNDILKASFILNICLLSMATIYVKFVRGNQEIVTNVSISVALFQFIGITCFHICLCLKNTKLAKSLRKIATKKPPPISEKSTDETVSAQEIASTVIELREPLLDCTLN